MRSVVWAMVALSCAPIPAHADEEVCFPEGQALQILAEVEELRATRPMVRLLEERLELSDARAVNLLEAVSSAVAAQESALVALEVADARRIDAESSASAWWRAPALWLLGGVSLTLAGVLAIWAL